MPPQSKAILLTHHIEKGRAFLFPNEMDIASDGGEILQTLFAP